MKLVPEVILQRYIQDKFEQFQDTFVDFLIIVAHLL